MRIDYVSENLSEPAAIVSAIRERRGGQLLELDRMLLHSPLFAAGWNQFLGAVRNELGVPQKLAELAICYVAVINEADYELAQHGPLFIESGGTDAQLSALVNDRDPSLSDEFTTDERAILKLTREMTSNVTVTDQTFEAARSVFSDKQTVVEMIGVIAAYNMVSRFLVTLEIKP